MHLCESRRHRVPGLSTEEVQATGFREQVFHRDDIARLHETRLRALSGTMPFENEQRVRRADGQYRWFLIQYNPVPDDNGRIACWYATGTDIEDRKRAENQLRQDERELRQLMDALPQHVLVLDKNGALLQANRTLLDYKGSTLEEMKARRRSRAELTEMFIPTIWRESRTNDVLAF